LTLLLFVPYPARSEFQVRGGAIVYRIALWYPNLVTHIFAVCTPYIPPTTNWVPLEQFVIQLPNFMYQLQLASGDIERAIKTRDDIRAFLNAVFGGKGRGGRICSGGGVQVRFAEEVGQDKTDDGEGENFVLAWILIFG
jgi:hypothetical protein